MSDSATPAAASTLGKRPPRRRAMTSLLAHGEPMVWLTGGALALALLMILGLLALIFYNGSTTFWPGRLYEIHTLDGQTFLGEMTRSDEFTVDVGMLASMAEPVRQRIEPRFLAPLERRRSHAAAVGEDTLARYISDIVERYGDDYLRKLDAKAARDEPAGGRALWSLLHEQSDPLVLDALGSRLDEAEDEAEPGGVEAERIELIREVIDTEGDRAIRHLQTLATEQVSVVSDELRFGISPLLDAARQDVADEARRRLQQAAADLESRANRDADFADALEQLTEELLTADAVLHTLHEAAAGAHEIDADRIGVLLERLEPRLEEYGRSALAWELDELRQKQDAIGRIRDTLGADGDGYPFGLEDDVVDPALPLLAQVRILRGQLEITAERRLYRTGNFELPPQTDFTWIPDFRIKDEGTRFPEWGLLFEREEWGRFYGYPEAFMIDGEPVATDPAEIWALFREHHGRIRDAVDERRALERYDLGRTSRIQEQGRLAVSGARLRYEPPPAWVAAHNRVVEAKRPLRDLERTKRRIDDLEAQLGDLPQEDPGDDDSRGEIKRGLEQWRDFREQLEQQREQAETELRAAEEELRVTEQIVGTAHPSYIEAVDAYEQLRLDVAEMEAPINRRRHALREEMARYGIAMRTANDHQRTLLLSDIARAYAPNRLSNTERWGVYFSRWREFLTDDPRDANMEGGVLPAIFGTVTMTLLMSIVVVPFGVLAALYLREYAKAGPMISALRIAINNLAGVPSIVFGVFGMGFFIYTMGAWVDQGPREPMTTTHWWWGVGLLVLLTIAALLVSLFARRFTAETIPGRATKFVGAAVTLAWVAAVLTAIALIAWNPHFGGFYAERGDTSTFRSGGVLWASLTLALLTLPVVIVATEEALAAVPSSLREGSYACGASKWQTIRRIVLPRAMPGIMTGTILAMARGAGEVAPLMLTGAVMLAPSLPVDLHNWSGTLGPIPTGPVHLERSFMHLGFHIYDIGFQSRDSEAARPMVYTTTLLLIAIVTALNIAAITLRSRLQKKFIGSQF